MKRVYSSDDFLMVGALRQVLEDHHVACVIKNEHLIGGAGELPPTECWPELWIAEDALLDKAMGLVQAFVASSRHRQPGWTCPACGEAHEGQFSECWRCQTTRPADAQPLD